MNQKLQLVTINVDYCNYLRNYDNRVSQNNGEKSGRPWIGALLAINNMMYFAPLASPKKKHLEPKMEKLIDFIRIDEGRLGGVNLNNAIPVTKDNIKKVDLKIKSSDDDKTKQYKLMLLKQLQWLIMNDEKIYDKAKKLYDFYVNDKLWPSLKNRCCNFPLLEEKCQEYNELGS